MLHFIKNKTLPAPFPKQLKDVVFSPAVYRSSRYSASSPALGVVFCIFSHHSEVWRGVPLWLSSALP